MDKEQHYLLKLSEKGDEIETKPHIEYYRKQIISEVGNIQYIVDNNINGTILFKHEDDWQLLKNNM